MRSSVSLVAAATLVASAVGGPTAPTVPVVALKNSAAPGQSMPAIGLGTGAYSDNPAVGYGGYPQCWAEIDPTGKVVGCGGWAARAVLTWIEAGGRRIDAANSYQNHHAVGTAMALSQVPRADFFLLSKVGPSLPLGFNDTLAQFADIKAQMGVTYVDLLLVHWPVATVSQGNVTNNATISTDPACDYTHPATYNEKACRLSTWRAMVQIWQSGGAKAIGVSNYNVTHFTEIIDAGLPLPSVVQNPYHLYHSAMQADTIAFCRAHDILFLGYSPLGVPDYHLYPTTDAAGQPTGMSSSQLADPVVVDIATAIGRSPADVLLAWQWQQGIPFNPRTMNEAHMKANLAVFDVTLSPSAMAQLSARPQDKCAGDAKWYECWNTTATA